MYQLCDIIDIVDQLLAICEDETFKKNAEWINHLVSMLLEIRHQIIYYQQIE